MIISISGKIGSGKDTVGKIIQLITDNPQLKDEAVENWLGRDLYKPTWEIKKWADKLKDIVCLLIGCTREQLENHEFKETELGEEWTRYAYADGHNEHYRNGEWTKSMNTVWCSKERYEEEKRINWQTAYKQPLTPRLLLQLIGTECGRNIIHPNIWVNSLMSEYRTTTLKTFTSDKPIIGNTKEYKKYDYPDWIITDTRFPNELQAVKDKGGISIKVVRPKEPMYLYNGDKYNLKDLFTEVHKDTGEYPLKVYADDNWLIKESEHESETALDNATFDYEIYNDGSIQDLIVKVRKILTKEKIIT